MGKWLFLILVAGISPAQAAIPAGTYSNVCLHTETGDLLGIQLEITYSNGTPNVLLWSCEGGCGWALTTSQVAILDNQIAFTATEELIEHPSGKSSTTSWRFTATRDGTDLVLASPSYEPQRQQLRMQTRIKPTGNPKALPIAVRRCT